jgi:hypothetical protein
LIDLLPKLAGLRFFDNSTDADPAAGRAPKVRLVLEVRHGKITGPPNLETTPDWAKPVVAAAMKLAPKK